MFHGLILLPLVLDTAVPFIFESQPPSYKYWFLAFVIASASKVMILRLEKICELLEYEITAEFRDFTESKKSGDKVDYHALLLLLLLSIL